MLDAGKAFGTHRAFGQGIRIAFDVDDDAVFDGDFDAAAAVAAFTGG